MKGKLIDSMIRVDHAGEYAAVCIYHGQEIALKDTDDAKQISEMRDHELVHFRYFDNKLKECRVRPTVFMPVWHTMAVSLGYVTALMGKEAAMACTEAVEEVICEHYDEQIAQLKRYGCGEEIIGTIKKFRDDEQEHMDIAAKGGADNAIGYTVLTSVVKVACRIGIAVSKVL
ncbi:MAG: demethoxyubiquinone hydroxylase family protein [Aaplasma endosymbiont of Hyalomma asiaticum]